MSNYKWKVFIGCCVLALVFTSKYVSRKGGGDYDLTNVNSEYSGRVSYTVHSKVAYFQLAHDKRKYQASVDLKEIYPDNIYNFLKINDSVVKKKGVDTLYVYRDTVVFKLKILDPR
ncbi:hypothetical protein GC194_14695 [bacterium]|nr:hypothetical protein [bacterium]